MILIFLIIPLFWLYLLDIKLNLKERVLIGVTLFWVVITPLIWILNKFGNYLITPEMFWILVALITLVLLIYFLVKNKLKVKFKFKKIHFDWSLIITLFIYACLHLLFYRFYVTMPEWDGYTNILRIEEMTDSGNIEYQYRPFFYTGMTILTQVTKVDPYMIHVFWMIILSAEYLVAMSIFVDINRIKSWWKKLLILFSGLAVPVINMEIDFFRPQNLYLVFFPVIFWLERKNKDYLAFLICLIGLGYHQFFIFPAMVLGLKVFLNFSKKNKFLFLSLILFLFGFFYKRIINYLPVNRIFENIGSVSKWRWWFLNSYQTYPDNMEMGWPGIGGAMKYYGYYFGPLVLVVLLILVFNLKKFISKKYWLLLIVLLLSVCELLPRLNVVYLPERFPVLVDLMVLMLLPNIFSKFKINPVFWLILILVGISGSVYIAKNKNSSTDKEELEVADWIKKNTPEDAIVFSQMENDVIVKYFSKRKFVKMGSDFWSNGIFNSDGKYMGNFTWLDYHCGNCYAMYSTRKFSGLISEREYRKEHNYLDANLNNLFLLYTEIYNKNGIIIWNISERN
jgi:hypothetical protein